MPIRPRHPRRHRSDRPGAVDLRWREALSQALDKEGLAERRAAHYHGGHEAEHYGAVPCYEAAVTKHYQRLGQFKTALADTGSPAADATAGAAPAPATPTGAGNAMPSTDPLSLLPPAPKPTAGGGATAAPDDPLSLLPPAPKPAGAAATTTTPTDKGGIARNIAAGTLEGEAGVMNVLSDPYANLIARPLATAGAFLYDAGAHATGLYNPLTPEQRAALLSDDYMPPPGTRAINALGDVVGAKPSDVTATTREEQIARAGSAGVAASPLIPGGLLAPIIGGGAVIAGVEAAKQVPDWAKPGTELAVNLLTGLAIPFGAAGVKAGAGPLARGVNAYVNAPGEGLIPGRSRPEELSATLARVMRGEPAEAQTDGGGGGASQPGMGGPQPAGAQVTRLRGDSYAGRGSRLPRQRGGAEAHRASGARRAGSESIYSR